MPIQVGEIGEQVAKLSLARRDLAAGKLVRAHTLVLGGASVTGNSGIGWQAMQRALVVDAERIAARTHNVSTVRSHLDLAIRELNAWAARGGKPPATWPHIPHAPGASTAGATSSARRSAGAAQRRAGDAARATWDRAHDKLSPETEAKLRDIERQVAAEAQRRAAAARAEQERIRRQVRDLGNDSDETGSTIGPSTDPLERLIDGGSAAVERMLRSFGINL